MNASCNLHLDAFYEMVRASVFFEVNECLGSRSRNESTLEKKREQGNNPALLGMGTLRGGPPSFIGLRHTFSVLFSSFPGAE